MCAESAEVLKLSLKAVEAGSLELEHSLVDWDREDIPGLVICDRSGPQVGDVRLHQESHGLAELLAGRRDRHWIRRDRSEVHRGGNRQDAPQRAVRPEGVVLADAVCSST